MSPYAAAVLTLADGLRAAFPSLNIKVQEDHPEVDLSIDIPRQAGLPFDINLNLQEDELHLSVAGFWRSYHPANQPDVLQWFQETIAGLLSGSHRIVPTIEAGGLWPEMYSVSTLGSGRPLPKAIDIGDSGESEQRFFVRQSHRMPSNRPLERAGMTVSRPSERASAGRSTPGR
jgi:hypothetical protein